MNSGIRNFVTHLECSATGRQYPAAAPIGLSEAGKPLLVRYDLEAVRAAVAPPDFETRAPDMWRYRELLPVRDSGNIVTLGEIQTPLISCPRLEERLGLADEGALLVKDESRMPTGSFKARGLAMAVSMARELGIERVAMPTAGNAGAALSAYCTRAGIEAFIFCPADTPDLNIRETCLQGGRVFRIEGLINDCGKLVGKGTDEAGWFDFSTLKEPYRIEGKKTMGLELAEQLGWRLPDIIFYPTGGGTGLIAMWKAFDELAQLGWLEGPQPRMVAVQSTGCAPIVKAFDEGAEAAEFWQNAETMAAGIRVPAAIGDFLILEALRDSGGLALAVSEAEIEAARAEVGAAEGLLLSPEGAATFAGYKAALADGRVGKDETAVLFNTGSGLKYPMPDDSRLLDLEGPIDFRELTATAR